MHGVHDNPKVKEFVANTQVLRVINSFTRSVEEAVAVAV